MAARAPYIFVAQFQGGLQPGYYATVTLTDPGEFPEPFTIDTADIVVQQRIDSGFGQASQLGVVSLSPPTTGSSPPTMYVPNVPGTGAPGFTVPPGGPGDPGYRMVVTVVDAATPVSWGRVKRLYR